MITVNITSDTVHSGKTTLAVEVAKFIAERTGEAVDIVSDTHDVALMEKYHANNSLDGLKVKIVDLNGNSEEEFKTVAVLHHVSVGKE
jgi:hypothetical protein